MSQALNNIDLTAAQRKEVAALLQRYLPDTEVWAYGSRVKFTAKPHSDLDMVAFASKEQSQAVANLREAFEESYLPFRVDLFVWDEVPGEFHGNIEEARVVVQKKKKGYKLPEGWQQVILGDVITINDATYSSKDKWSFINYLDTGNLTNGAISEVKNFIIGADKIPSRAKRKIQPGDIVYSTVRPNQKHFGIIKNLPENLLVSTAFVTIRGKKEKADTNFVYFLLTQRETIEILQTIGEHSTSAYPSIKPSDIQALKFNLPPLSEQKAIAHILGSLDDKIELNRRMNETLEAMAQALFKSWFVDFDPVIDNALAAGNAIPDELKEKAAIRQGLGDEQKSLPDDIRRLFPSEFAYTEEMGWIPKGWEVGLFGEYVSVKRGGSPRPIQNFLAPQGFPWVKISDATSCTSRFLKKTKQFIKPEGLNKTIQLEPGTLILSNSATPGIPIFLDLQACIHDGWLYFPEKKHFNDAYLYQLFLVIKEQLLMQGNGSVFTNLKTDILRNQKLIIPQKNIIQKFAKISKKWIQKIYSLNAEIQSTSSIRDTLLSRFLAGEIRIPSAKSAYGGKND